MNHDMYLTGGDNPGYDIELDEPVLETDWLRSDVNRRALQTWLSSDQIGQLAEDAKEGIFTSNFKRKVTSQRRWRMHRPRKSTLDAWSDTFLSLDRSDREGTLRVLEISHRAACQTEDRIRQTTQKQPPPVGACLELGQEESWLDAMMRGGIAE